MSKAETTGEYFDRTAQVFAAKYRESLNFRERLAVWQDAVEKVVPGLPDGALCLDIGCGDGVFGRMLARRGIRTIGIDQSEAMLAMARAMDLEEGGASPTAYEASVVPLPPELERRYAGAADLIVCSSVLEYIADYEAALMQFFRLLKPQGVLLLSLPNRQSLYRAGERGLRGLLSLKDSYLRHQRHQFSFHETGRLLESLGHKVLDATFFSLPVQAISGRLFPRYRGPWLATMFLITVEKVGTRPG